MKNEQQNRAWKHLKDLFYMYFIFGVGFFTGLCVDLSWL